MGEPEVVVLLNTTWDPRPTAMLRWQFVAPRLHGLGLAGRVVAVDFPHFRRRAAVDPRFPLVRPLAAAAPYVELVDLTVAAAPAPGPLDAFGWSRTARALDRWLGSDPADRVVIGVNPLTVPLLRALPAAHRGFDADDDWRHYPAVAAFDARLRRGYEQLRHLGVVTANSAALAQRLRLEGVGAVHVGNGVDVAAFGRDGVDLAVDLPSRPFAVYVGSLQSRVDLDALAVVAEGVADVMDVVVAGPAEDPEAARLRAGPWRWIGPVPHDAVPTLLRRACVGLLPHRFDAFTDSMEPLKVLEYIAAGLPVVATELPGLAELEPAVRVARTPQEMAQLTRTAPATHDPAAARRLLAGRDWNDVTRCLFDLHTGRTA